MAISLWKIKRPFEGILTVVEDYDGIEVSDTIESRDQKDWVPAVDVEEKGGKYLLRADLPGMKREDIHLELKEGYLMLKGERRNEKEENNKEKFSRLERKQGCFQRCFRLPEGVTEKDISVMYHNGVLELSMPSVKQKNDDNTHNTV